MTWQLLPELPWLTYGNRCCVCFTDRKNECYMDGGIDVEGEGRYVICERCFREGARLLDLVPKEKAKPPKRGSTARDDWNDEWDKVNELAGHLVDMLCEHGDV